MSRVRTSSLLVSIIILTGLASAAHAARRAPDRFPLGVSAQSGAVCEAVRNDDDPAAQQRGARAWDVRCRGWDAPLGRLYSYDWKGAAAVADKGLWTTTLTSRAQCGPEAQVQIATLGAVNRAACKAFDAKVAYLAYSTVKGGLGVAADGYANLSDVLETGMKVVTGTAQPPKATETLANSSGAGGEPGSLVRATEAAEAAPENLRERGYTRNLAWLFSDAETDFGALAQNPAAPTQARAEAYLNWALNTSNLGRFTRADALFADAEKLIGSDKSLRGELLSYRALHLRNQKKFTETIAASQAARSIFTSLAPSTELASERPVVTKDASNAVVIGPRMASALSARSSFSTAALPASARTVVQVAQTYLTEATAQNALGDRAGARHSLEQAHALLADPSMARVAVWMRVQVDSELAREAEAGGRPGDARARLLLALQQLRQHQAGSAAEAYLLLELAKSEALSGDQTAALRDFEQGVVLFKAVRGSLGASADSADTYFSLLLTRIDQDPAHTAEYANRFLEAAESLGSEATADTVARLSARLNQTDNASAGLIRALEDTRRQVRLQEGVIAQLQAQNVYTPASRTAHEAELKSLVAQTQDLEQKVAALDPRYGQLVTTEVSLKALQAKLKPGEMFVKVVLLDQNGYGIAVGPDWVKPYRLGMGASAAESTVTKLRRPFETEGRLPTYDVSLSYDFFEALFGPVQDRVLAARHIIYEPATSILALPIAALATDAKSVDLIASRRAAIRAKGEGVLSYAGVDWLGKTADTSLVVSAASFVEARDVPASPAKRPFLGFGASVQPDRSDRRAFASVVEGGSADPSQLDDDICKATRTALLALKPLNEARQELQAVGASLGAGPGSDVTGVAFSDGEIAARKDLDQYRVLYFATHGLLPKPGGCLPEPSLLTSVNDALAGSDGLLTASKILGLRLDADLVVLSACDTGGGVDSELDQSGLGGAGEALGGLTRAFIYAGARTLVVSHWQIDSKATVRLMTAMFEAREPTLGGAMRQAANSFMNSPDQYSHPYYWAAFTIVGDGGRPMPTR